MKRYLYQEDIERKSKKKWPFILLTFLVAVCGSYLAQTYLMTLNGNEYSVERLNQISDNTVLEKTFRQADVIENAMKSVVGISMLKANEESIFDIATVQKWGLGTGIVVSEDGYILTNQHLARNKNTKVLVTLNNGETVQGKVVWAEENIDLAILKVDKKGLEVATLGNSDNIRIGDSVFAIGNPLGVEFQRSTTSGIISGVNRTLTFEEKGKTIFMEDLIQTDASINVGNSGGPLINANGEVIGVNTVKITTAEGIGFAVPINLIVPIINRYITDGSFDEVELGVFVYDKEIIKYIQSNIGIENGIYVASVIKQSPADKSGIAVGDIILSIDGIYMDKVTDLRRFIYGKKKGEEIMMILNRNNEIINVKVIL